MIWYLKWLMGGKCYCNYGRESTTCRGLVRCANLYADGDEDGDW
jgi:hypothetical protein